MTSLLASAGLDTITEAQPVARNEAARAQGIRSCEQPTRVANAPSPIKGVVNLRGVIVLKASAEMGLVDQSR